MIGYDFDLVKKISNLVSVPVIAAGGARDINDFHKVVKDCGASAAAAGASFVYYGKHRAVLITYPSEDERGNL